MIAPICVMNVTAYYVSEIKLFYCYYYKYDTFLSETKTVAAICRPCLCVRAFAVKRRRWTGCTGRRGWRSATRSPPRTNMTRRWQPTSQRLSLWKGALSSSHSHASAHQPAYTIQVARKLSCSHQTYDVRSCRYFYLHKDRFLHLLQIDDRFHNRFMGRHFENGRWDEGVISTITH